MADQRFDESEKYGDGFDPIDDEVWVTQQAAPLDVEKTLAGDTVEWQQTRVGAPRVPAPVPSPPQQEAPVPEVGAYDQALDRGSRLSLKLAVALLAVLAVLVVGSIVVSEAVGSAQKAAGAAADAVAGAVGSGSGTEAASGGSDGAGGSDEGASSSGWGISGVLGELSDKARDVVSGADGLQDTAKDVASALDDAADKLGGIASGLGDAAGKLGDALR